MGKTITRGLNPPPRHSRESGNPVTHHLSRDRVLVFIISCFQKKVIGGLTVRSFLPNNEPDYANLLIEYHDIC
jgi:hypothetical protein